MKRTPFKVEKPENEIYFYTLQTKLSREKKDIEVSCHVKIFKNIQSPFVNFKTPPIGYKHLANSLRFNGILIMGEKIESPE